MTESFFFRGKEYTKDRKNDLYYRVETIDGVTFDVPMHINRIPGGWQVRFQRHDSKYFSRAFADGKDSNRGPWAKLSFEERLRRRMQRSLDLAIKELKTLFRNNTFAAREDALIKARQAVSKRPRSGNSTGLPGLQVKLMFPKPTAREKTPFIVVHSRLGQGKNIMLGPTFRTSIFKLTPAALKAQVKKAVTARKFMEDCQASGKRFSMEKLNFISYDVMRRYENAATTARVSFDDFLTQTESEWALPETLDSVSLCPNLIESREVISVGRKVETPGTRRQAMNFYFDEYESTEQCERVAKLYARYISGANPRVSQKVKRGRKRLSPADYNRAFQPKTEMTGVSYSFLSNYERFVFFAVYMDAEGNRHKRSYSVKKYGLRQAFMLARRHFNTAISREEGESILNMRYNKMLPILLRDLPQKVINLYKLADNFSGISYSSLK